jgi:hypothetical protein
VNKAIDILVKVFLVLVAVGTLALLAAFINWPVGLEHKINLLRSLLIAATALLGFTGVFLIKIIRDGEVLVREFGMSERRVNNLRVFVSWSGVIGFLAILTVMFYFITYEINLIIVAWIFFILQLEFFVLPLIFARVITFH